MIPAYINIDVKIRLHMEYSSQQEEADEILIQKKIAFLEQAEKIIKKHCSPHCSLPLDLPRR